MSTHPIARQMAKALKEGATIVMPEGAKEWEKVFPPNRVAACMILGDGYDKDKLTACVKSLKDGGVDKLFIAYNGKTRRSLQWLFNVMNEIELPFLIQKYGWEDDFALARNQSFALVPKDEFDWIMWIDSDDVFVVEPIKGLTKKETLTNMLDSLDPYTQGVYLRYDYAHDPETGAVGVVQWRERILRANVEWQWVYPIHEVVFSPTGTQFARKDGAFIRHQRNVLSVDPAARARNRRIITKALKENPKNPRMQFYLANEVMAEAEAEEDPEQKYRNAKAAIVAYKRYLSNDQDQVDNLFHAAVRVGECYLMIGEYNDAIDAFLNALKIIPDWPDPYIGIARAAMELEDWPRCKAFCDIALKMVSPQTHAATTPLTHAYTPLLLRGIANEEMGNLDQALEDYLSAKAIWTPKTGMLEARIESVKEKLAVRTQDKDLRKTLRGKKPEKSIAFVTAPLVEPWHPRIEEESGAGGAETCIMRLAPRFAADGWRTVVFGTPADHRGVDENGVEWWNSNEFLPNEEFAVLVSSRVPEIFESRVAAKKRILWMHDVNVGPRLYPFVDRLDVIVGLTNWHKYHMSRLYELPLDKFAVVPNGIELDLFDWDKKQPSNGDLRLIWSSSPDRGLSNLVALWPTIKGMYPTSRLDIFYGWNIIDKLIKTRKSSWLIKLKQEILGNIEVLGGEDAGIYQHGRVPQSELAQWQLNAHIWPYTTDFMETFCITAVEMQAAGVIPVTSRLAALPEVVASPELMVEGWPLNRDYQRRWLSVFEGIVEADADRQIELQNTGREFSEQFTWDHAYSKWNDLFSSMN